MAETSSTTRRLRAVERKWIFQQEVEAGKKGVCPQQEKLQREINCPPPKKNYSEEGGGHWVLTFTYTGKVAARK